MLQFMKTEIIMMNMTHHSQVSLKRRAPRLKSMMGMPDPGTEASHMSQTENAS